MWKFLGLGPSAADVRIAGCRGPGWASVGVCPWALVPSRLPGRGGHLKIDLGSAHLGLSQSAREWRWTG